jgi:hypothetical protein
LPHAWLVILLFPKCGNFSRKWGILVLCITENFGISDGWWMHRGVIDGQIISSHDLSKAVRKFKSPIAIAGAHLK